MQNSEYSDYEVRRRRCRTQPLSLAKRTASQGQEERRFLLQSIPPTEGGRQRY